jgi:phage/plasmid-associated DNA primase
LKKSFLKEEADPDLKQKLEWEHEDIFAWAVKWLARLLIRWNFEEQPELTANLESYLKEQDTVALFIEDDSVNLWDGYKCPVRELYEWYRSFCKDSGRSPLNLSNFKTNLKAKWIVNTRSANKRYYLGIEYISPNSSYSSWWN